MEDSSTKSENVCDLIPVKLAKKLESSLVVVEVITLPPPINLISLDILLFLPGGYEMSETLFSR